MMRGDVVAVVLQSHVGKTKPALVIQADQFSEHITVTLLPITSMLVDAPLLRINVQPSVENGLLKPAQIMLDKPITVKRDKIEKTFGRLNLKVMAEVERCLVVFLGIAK